MNKILTLELMKNLSIDNIIELYNKGYRLGNNIYQLQEGTASITFVVRSGDYIADQTLIYVDGVYRGITDINGTLTVQDLSAGHRGTSHTFLAVRQGYNARNGRIFIFPNIDHTESVLLTDYIADKGSIFFQVNAFGMPVEGAHIIIRDQEVGMTGPDGTFLAEGLDQGRNIPYTVKKEGFDDIFGYLFVDNRFTFTTGLILLTRPEPNAPILFTTIDTSGLPIGDVEIRIDDNLVGKTDNDGSFIAIIDSSYNHSYIVSKHGFTTISGIIEKISFRMIPIIMTKS